MKSIFLEKSYTKCGGEASGLSRYILLTDQISLPDCFHFLRYWQYVYFNYLLSNVQSVAPNFEINLSFVITMLFSCNQKSGQKCKYLKNEISF